MTTIRQIFDLRSPSRSFTPHPLVVGIERVGIEVELEDITTSSSRLSDDLWNAIYDGSLRNNGMEFVTRGDGIGGKTLSKALVQLDKQLKDLNPDNSWRCSTHVHVDARDMTVQEIKNLIIIYTVYERFLFKASGWERYKSNFCVPLGVGQRMIRTLADSWHNDTSRFVTHLCDRWNKYTAINFCTLGTLGTVEFRMSEAQWRKGTLLKLVNRFLCIKNQAKTWQGTHEELIEHCITTPVAEMFTKGVTADAVFEQEDLELGAKLAYDIIYTGRASRDRRAGIEADRIFF